MSASTRHAPAARRLSCGHARRAARCAAQLGSGPEAAGASLKQRATASVAAVLLLLAPPATALDQAKVGACLFESCVTELSRCLADEKCAESLVCLNKCNGAPDESGCQIRCGDLYNDKVVRDFNACAVTRAGCVPQRADEGLYPVPPPAALVPAIDVAELEGRWWITAGLNKLFDVFDCQEHFFTSNEAGKLFIKVNWRVARPNGQFYERHDLQRFVQDEAQPAVLLNHGNEMLHYQDDWYVVAYKKDAYMLVYYRGKNDAWDGYGGAVVYTRERTLPKEYVPELEAAAAAAGLKWSDFQVTNNSCPPPPRLAVVAPADLDTLADDVVALGSDAEKSVEEGLVSFSRGFTMLRGEEKAAEGAVSEFLTKEERLLEEELADARDALETLERKISLSDFFSAPFRALARVLRFRPA